VRDVAVLLQAIAGYDPQDPSSIDAPTASFVSDLEGGVRDWRIALALKHFYEPGEEVSQEALQAVEQAARVFKELGARLERIEMSGRGEAGEMIDVILLSEAAAFHRERLQKQRDGFGAETLQTLEYGAGLSAVDYAHARRFQRKLSRHFETFFRDYDLLLTPTTPLPAPRYDATDEEQARRASLTSFTAPFNLLGLPALSLPCGFTAGGLPLGLQICGPRWSEARVLRAGYSFEQATSWHSHRPAL
jgi:aspartyl-tRNA(Asn)/glutamyl-tRNA(Gln) amidotransferase subunit A